MKFIKNSIISLIESKNLIFSLSKDDFKIKYAGSYLGVVWGFIPPLVTVLLYWFVFQVGFKNGARPDGTPYILWLIAGIIPWFFFSEAWSSATSCLYDYSFLVKKVVFKVGILPVIKIISALFVHFFFLDILFIIFATYGYQISWYNIQIIYYLICVIALVYVLALITSSLAVFIKDINQLIGIILQIFFWMIPIVWTPESFSDNVLTILKFNPLYYIVDGYRDSMINEIWFWEKPLYTLYFWVFLFVMLMAGVRIYRKLKKHFADVL